MSSGPLSSEKTVSKVVPDAPFLGSLTTSRYREVLGTRFTVFVDKSSSRVGSTMHGKKSIQWAIIIAAHDFSERYPWWLSFEPLYSHVPHFRDAVFLLTATVEEEHGETGILDTSNARFAQTCNCSNYCN